MKKLIRIATFRYPVSDIFMMIGLCLSIVALFFFRNISSQNEGLRADKYDHYYKYSEIIDFSGGDLDEIPYAAQKTGYGIYRLEEVPLFINDADVTKLSTIVFSANEKMKYDLDKAFVSDPASETYPCAIIGNELEKYAYVSEGREYITIQNEEYIVAGVAKSGNSSLQDHLVVLFYLGAGENVKELLKNYSGWSILVCSDLKDVSGLGESIKDELPEDSKMTLFEDRSGGEKRYDHKNETDGSMFTVIYAFCIINCVTISWLWSSERKYEIALKKTLGFGQVRLALDLYIQLLRPLVYAFVICLFLNMFGADLYYEGIQLCLGITIPNMLMIIIVSLLSAAFITLICVKRSRKERLIDMRGR
ncbi:MAG: hypothetical protein IKO30_01335 [Lachnospiraceae bacterium]|nr:hypothetical protein [Lachnospiraceae bacterium]